MHQLAIGIAVLQYEGVFLNRQSMLDSNVEAERPAFNVVKFDRLALPLGELSVKSPVEVFGVLGKNLLVNLKILTTLDRDGDNRHRGTGLET